MTKQQSAINSHGYMIFRSYVYLLAFVISWGPATFASSLISIIAIIIIYARCGRLPLALSTHGSIRMTCHVMLTGNINRTTVIF